MNMKNVRRTLKDLDAKGKGREIKGSRAQTLQISRAMIWALANAGWKAGSY